MFDYRVDTSLDVPIYQQITDAICADIKSGRLTAGTQLPTVRDLADQLGVARGSVKRAYDELEKNKLIEKSQGKGTFVAYRPMDSESRKVRAVALIDQLLDQLEEMDFSDREINIYLGLKLREHAQRRSKLKVALLDCNPEVLGQLGEQLREMFQIDLYTFLLHEVLAYPYKIDEDIKLILVPVVHADVFEQTGVSTEKTVRIALRPTAAMITGIVKIPEEAQVGILCASERFGMIVENVCSSYTEHVHIAAPCRMDDASAVDAYLQGKTTLLVPGGFELYADDAVTELIRQFRHDHSLVECSYKIDEGSLIYLKEKIGKLLRK